MWRDASLPVMEPTRTQLGDALGDRDPTEVLRATPAHLEARVNDPGASWDVPWRQGGWTARQLIAHLCDYEIAFAFRARNLVAAAEAPHVAEPYEADLWAREYGRMDPALAVDAFRALRAWNLAWLARRDLQDWLRTYRPPGRDAEESLDELVRRVAAHDLRMLDRLARGRAT